MPDAVSVAHDLPALLEKHFGYRTFRPLQEDIMKTVIGGGDALVVMPTGSGKSICFQLPALCRPGTALVVSPLIALMKDQVDGLRENGVAAAYLNSSLSFAEQTAVKTSVEKGETKLLYIAPERLGSPGFQNFLSSISVSLIAIDEAHCISTWGHEFRPEYRSLLGLREMFPSVPTIALTATATPQVRDDIRAQLRLDTAPLFLSSFNRENLTYHVYPKHRAFDRLLLFLKDQKRLPAIIYCFSRRDTEQLADDLKAEGIQALPYHAGLDPQVRKAAQDAFMRDDVRIITATIAFGMGIDKPDVRTVVHMDLPKTVESYYQETGRAGRDGLPSDCILFFSFADKFKQEFFIEQMEPPQQVVAREKLRQMLDYGDLRACRRSYLLSYFGEEPSFDNCKGCDRCLATGDTFDATEISQKILSAVIRTGERFGAAHVCDVLRGKKLERIRAQGHHTLSVFGIVKDFDDRQLREIVGFLIDKKFLRKSTGEYPTLSVTDAGRGFLAEKKPLMLRKPEETVSVIEREETQVMPPYDPQLFEELRILRRTIADEQKVVAFVVFGDRSLMEMASFFPQSTESFVRIYGVSTRKLEQYGDRFLAVIRQFCSVRNLPERQNLSKHRDRQRQRRERMIRKRGSTYDDTRILILQGFPLAQIAARRSLKENTIVEHAEELLSHGAITLRDIAAFKPLPDIFDPIAASFARHGTVALSPVFQEFDGKYPYDLLRLVRMFVVPADSSSSPVV